MACKVTGTTGQGFLMSSHKYAVAPCKPERLSLPIHAEKRCHAVIHRTLHFSD